MQTSPYTPKRAKGHSVPPTSADLGVLAPLGSLSYEAGGCRGTYSDLLGPPSDLLGLLVEFACSSIGFCNSIVQTADISRPQVVNETAR